ncbi:hypothetical protein PPL_04563 [Heterostelium album PN500]|uniref:Uncharacterized protein n=1 Tax=Heterostelium pallidum (strain ATCC 26659 / Pp 5 / PN500) TaxID=670386 RepID=D3B7X5_HETP5|nr:hypothetical protein PPL_04563 [Heterostelium album PN500]EFA82143.1 hypothetical protein PPL_04563 [Heterostelium album PN500]|eukprot:XP_020434260.1 hypothetical protein PPL_04563 [Heterostelium album PN500]
MESIKIKKYKERWRSADLIDINDIKRLYGAMHLACCYFTPAEQQTLF